MKKILLLMGVLLPMLGFMACSDEHDLPDVTFNVTISDAVNADGTIYVVKGNTLTVDAITVKNNESDKGAAIASASYYWDGVFLGTNYQSPFGLEIAVGEEVPVGKYELVIECPVMAVDKSLATAWLGYNVTVVESEEDLPDNGTTSFVVKPSVKEGDTK